MEAKLIDVAHKRFVIVQITSRVLFLLIALFPRIASTAEFTIPFDCWNGLICGTPPYHADYSCTTGSGTFTMPTCSFQDTFPEGIPISSWVFKVGTDQCSPSAPPITLTAKLNGQVLGSNTLQRSGSSVSCVCAPFGLAFTYTPIPYNPSYPYIDYPSPGSPPGYVAGGTNSIDMTWTPVSGGAQTVCWVGGYIVFQYPEANFVFPVGNKKMLIHKFGTGDYPEPLYQKGNGKIQIRLKITDGFDNVPPILETDPGDPLNGQTVYLRITDPQDTSPYVTPNPSYDPLADHDNTGGKATLTGDGIEETSSGSKVWRATSATINGEVGIVEATLQLPGFGTNTNTPSPAAGDNFAIQVSLKEDFSLMPRTSGTLTVWKRAYIEQDTMFRKGALLYDTYDPATCGSNCNKIGVYSWGETVSSFQVKKNDVIVFFDDTYSSGDPSLDVTTEKRKVTNVAINAGVATITFKNPTAGQPDKLTKGYEASNRDSSNMPFFTSGHSAAVGVMNSGFYTTPAHSPTTFDEGYVELISNSSEAGVLPYMPRAFFLSCLVNRKNFHQAWFKNKKPAPCTATCGGLQVSGDSCDNIPQNYFHLMGATAGEKGVAATNFDTDYTFLYEDALNIEVNGGLGIPALCTGNTATCTNEFNNYMTHTVNHETAHQFRVNLNLPCNPAEGHDSNKAWCGNPGASGAQGSCLPSVTNNSNCNNMTEEWCLMNGNDTIPDYYCQRIDGIDRLDCSDLKGVTCLGVTQDCSGTPPQSIRTISDPQ